MVRYAARVLRAPLLEKLGNKPGVDHGVFIDRVQKEFTLILRALVLLDVEFGASLKVNLLALVEQTVVVLTLLDLVDFGECPTILSPVNWEFGGHRGRII